jgi:putative ABC transport system ATP-binding protein
MCNSVANIKTDSETQKIVWFLHTSCASHSFRLGLMIRTSNLVFKYSKLAAELVFPDINLPSSSATVLLGKSGSGKSTLLHLIAGLLRPSQGEVWIGDTLFSGLKGTRQDAFRGRHIGMVFQKPLFAASLNALDNLKLSASLSSVQVKEQDYLDILERLGIADKASAKPQELSAGEQQRLSIARALLHAPSLVLADEPTSALDDHNAQTVVHLLKDVAMERSSTLLLVTHDNRVSSVFDKKIQL